MSEFATATAPAEDVSPAPVEAVAAPAPEAGAKKGKKSSGAPVPSKFGRVKSNLKMGILGLPNVGKSSLFNLLTEQSAAAENYPFCTIDPNESRCPIPDARFDWLCEFWEAPSRIPAYLMVTDIAGLIRGAHQGAGLGNAFLSHIQAVDGLYHVVRAFDNPEVVHVDDSVDPIRDMETITYELCRKDSAYVESVREKKVITDLIYTPKLCTAFMIVIVIVIVIVTVPVIVTVIVTVTVPVIVTVNAYDSAGGREERPKEQTAASVLHSDGQGEGHAG